jgi:hypothetical protein
MSKGTVKIFNDAKGLGFIPEEGKKQRPFPANISPNRTKFAKAMTLNLIYKKAKGLKRSKR